MFVYRRVVCGPGVAATGLVSLTAVLVILAVRPADAADAGDAGRPAAPTDHVTSACPRADAVWSALRPVVSSDNAPQDGLAAPLLSAPTIEIVDLGSAFRVGVNGRQREYRDDSRDCERRARVAAIFVGIALGLPQPSNQPATEVGRGVATPRPPAATKQIEVSVATETGLASGYHVTLLGAALRLALGAGRLKGVAGLAVLAPAEVTISAVSVRQAHVPVDVGLRMDMHKGSLELSIDAGLCAGLLWVRAVAVPGPETATIFEWGGKTSVLLRYRASGHFAPFVGGAAQVVAVPFDLYVLPGGVIGRSPRLWLGATAGVAF